MMTASVLVRLPAVKIALKGVVMICWIGCLNEKTRRTASSIDSRIRIAVSESIMPKMPEEVLPLHLYIAIVRARVASDEIEASA